MTTKDFLLGVLAKEIMLLDARLPITEHSSQIARAVRHDKKRQLQLAVWLVEQGPEEPTP